MARKAGKPVAKRTKRKTGRDDKTKAGKPVAKRVRKAPATPPAKPARKAPDKVQTRATLTPLSDRNPPTAGRAKNKRQVSIELARDYREMWDTTAGRRVLSDMLVHSSLAQIVDTKDPIELAMRMGERNMALRIVQMLGFTDADIPAAAWMASDTINGMQSERELYHA